MSRSVAIFRLVEKETLVEPDLVFDSLKLLKSNTYPCRIIVGRLFDVVIIGGLIVALVKVGRFVMVIENVQIALGDAANDTGHLLFF